MPVSPLSAHTGSMELVEGWVQSLGPVFVLGC